MDLAVDLVPQGERAVREAAEVVLRRASIGSLTLPGWQRGQGITPS